MVAFPEQWEHTSEENEMGMQKIPLNVVNVDLNAHTPPQKQRNEKFSTFKCPKHFTFKLVIITIPCQVGLHYYY